MEYHRISRGKENKFLHRTAQHQALISRVKQIVARLKWKFLKKDFCPKCLKITQWEVGAIQEKHFTKGYNPKYVIGVSHTCLECKLQIRKGIDSISEQAIGGMYEKDYTSKV